MYPLVAGRSFLSNFLEFYLLPFLCVMHTASFFIQPHRILFLTATLIPRGFLYSGPMILRVAFFCVCVVKGDPWLQLVHQMILITRV